MVLPDGRLVSGGREGLIKLWPVGSEGNPDVLQNGSGVSSLAVLHDGRLASADDGNDANITLWPTDGTGQTRGVQAG